MASAKDIIVKPITSADANKIIKALHYSHKVVNNSQLHFGVFLDGKCGGALSFGPSLDKRKIIGLVEGTGWNEFLELNRMAMADWLPKNGESRVLSVCLHLIKKNYPHIKWIVSFADGTQCGHGTMYQAAGFYLTGISKSENLAIFPDGRVTHKMTLESNPITPRPELGGASYYDVTNGRYNFNKYVDYCGGRVLPGYQFRYIYFLDPSCKAKLTVPILPYSKIGEIGGRMYKGKSIGAGSIADNAPSIHEGEGGLTPTPALQ